MNGTNLQSRLVERSQGGVCALATLVEDSDKETVDEYMDTDVVDPGFEFNDNHKDSVIVI